MMSQQEFIKLIGVVSLVYSLGGRLIIGYLRFNRLNEMGVELFNNYLGALLVGFMEFFFMLTFVPGILFGLFMLFIAAPLAA